MSNKILMALMSQNIVFYSFLASFLCFLSCHRRSRHCGLETICPISHLDVQGLHPVYVALNCSYVPSVTLFRLGEKKNGCVGCHSVFQLSELFSATWNPSAFKSKHKWRPAISFWKDYQHWVTTSF